MKLGLSEQQIAERRLRVHAGDASMVMEGRWRELWRIKVGLDPEPDLSGEFRVQLGSYTEPFGLAWTMQQTGRPIEYYSANWMMRAVWKELTGLEAHEDELATSKEYPWLAYNRDSISATPQGARAVLDAKHVARSGEAELLRYTAAGTLQATVEGVDWWGIAPIVGNKWEPPIFQEVDPLYQADLIARTREFFGYVERNEEPPEAQAPVLAPKPQPKLRTIHVPLDEVDGVYEALCRQENWLDEACAEITKFAGTHAAATAHNISRDRLKSLVPEDVGVLERGLFKFARDKAGSVRMSLKKGAQDDEP